jgi:hypothetical protein
VLQRRLACSCALVTIAALIGTDLFPSVTLEMDFRGMDVGDSDFFPPMMIAADSGGDDGMVRAIDAKVALCVKVMTVRVLRETCSPL